MAALSEWDTFYVIVGSAAGALIGLQFVVVTLIAERPPARVAEASAAFATPTIVHFGAVFLLSAVLRAPWETIPIASVFWGLIGIVGVVYVVVVARRMRTQGAYVPQFEDWLFHTALPLLAYGTLALSPLAVPASENGALTAVGAAALLLVLVGIHNAWDAVTYQVFMKARDLQGSPSVRETGSRNQRDVRAESTAGDPEDRGGKRS